MYLCPLVGSIKLTTIINLPSGSPSCLSYIKHPVQDNSGYSQHEDPIYTPQRGCRAGDSGSYRCADVSAMQHSVATALAGGLGMALPSTGTFRLGPRAELTKRLMESHLIGCSCPWGHRRVGTSLLGEWTKETTGKSLHWCHSKGLGKSGMPLMVP